MYFITTKTADGAFLVKRSVEKRDAARALAKELGGTVRTQAELDALGAAGKIESSKYVAPEVIKADEPKVDAKADEPKTKKGDWESLAHKVNETIKPKNTLGKKERVLKRPPTAQGVIDSATAYVREGFMEKSKVEFVRALALYRTALNATLLRADAFAIVKAVRPEIADATVSTQWQLARSGKAPVSKK